MVDGAELVSVLPAKFAARMTFPGVVATLTVALGLKLIVTFLISFFSFVCESTAMDGSNFSAMITGSVTVIGSEGIGGDDNGMEAFVVTAPASTDVPAAPNNDFGLKIIVTFLGDGFDGTEVGAVGISAVGASALKDVAATLIVDFGLKVMATFLVDGSDGTDIGAESSTVSITGSAIILGSAVDCSGEGRGDGRGEGADAGAGPSILSLLNVRICRQVANEPPPTKIVLNRAPSKVDCAAPWTCGTSGVTSDRDMGVGFDSGVGSRNEAWVFAAAPRTKGFNTVLVARVARSRYEHKRLNKLSREREGNLIVLSF